jgi:hypothetical protein
MTSSKKHYENVLTPVYSWMYGGFPAALERNSIFFREHKLEPRGSACAVDLGAGCGFQSIPLARMGYSVTAIDSDRQLLEELRSHASGVDIATIEDDLLNFRSHVPGELELAVCMTDTILHLVSPQEVSSLVENVYLALEPSGKFVVTFRDFTNELHELDRFIPVRSDLDVIFTCFLEYEPDTVRVHDLVYRRSGAGWTFSKGFYRKLRLSEQWLRGQLVSKGFSQVYSDASNGFITLVATK